MEKTIIKRVPLKVQELGNLREIICKELTRSMDVQFYLENALYEEIKFNYFDYKMSPEPNETRGHYENYSQDIYELQDSKGREVGTIGFVANCKECMQITKFKMDRIDYIHYNCGMKKIIIICEYKEKEE